RGGGGPGNRHASGGAAPHGPGGRPGGGGRGPGAGGAAAPHRRVDEPQALGGGGRGLQSPENGLSRPWRSPGRPLHGLVLPGPAGDSGTETHRPGPGGCPPFSGGVALWGGLIILMGAEKRLNSPSPLSS